MTSPLFETELVPSGRHVAVIATERSDGDMHPGRVARDVLLSRQRAVSGRRWIMADQVHGTAVHHAQGADAETTAPVTAATADVIASRSSEADVAIWAGDCAPVVLIGADGLVVGAHAGWRGLAGGVLDVAVDTVRGAGTVVVAAVLGPVIHPCCYAFGADDLALVARGVGSTVADIAAPTSLGAHGLDVPRAVRSALERHGIALDVVGPCTGCDERWFSHRVRTDVGRHAVVVTISENSR